MDLMTLQKRSQELSGRSAGYYSDQASPADGGARLGDLVKRINATPGTMTKNRWGGKDNAIDVQDYCAFMGALQSLSWIMRDMGFSCIYLTKNGQCFDQSQMNMHPGLFRRENGRVVAIVASKSGAHYRFTRDSDSLRIRLFKSYGQAIAPLQDGSTSGTKKLSAASVKELVKFMTNQSQLKPDPDSLLRWGRHIRDGRTKPYGVMTFKGMLKNEFKKFGRL